MTWPEFIGGACVGLILFWALRAFIRGARHQREEGAYAAMQNAVRTPPITKHVHRYPPMTEKAAKGFAKDPTVMRDQVSPEERRKRLGVARQP